jgi:hypothetical protein
MGLPAVLVAVLIGVTLSPPGQFSLIVAAGLLASVLMPDRRRGPRIWLQPAAPDGSPAQP